MKMTAILNMKTPYPQMAQIEQIFNAFSPGAARHYSPRSGASGRAGVRNPRNLRMDYNHNENY